MLILEPFAGTTPVFETGANNDSRSTLPGRVPARTRRNVLTVFRDTVKAGFEDRTVFEDWLDILLRGTYEVSLPTLTVTSGEIGTLTGSGQISWNADSGIRIQAVTDGGDVLTRLLFGGFGMPGHLIAHSTYLTFRGRTQQNWELTADQMSRDGHRTHTNLPDVVWDLGTSGITLRHETSVPMGRSLRILMGPLPPHWVRMTETEVRNEVFGHCSSRRD